MATKTATTKTAKKAAKKTATKTTTKTTDKKVKNTMQLDGKYFYAVGRRKTAVAQARIYPIKDVKKRQIIVNDRELKEYFKTTQHQYSFLAPLTKTGMDEKFSVTVLVRGGGQTGQAEASRLAIARALNKFDEGLRPTLKAEGFLLRDARKVERKKPGLKKARRAPQWSKR